MPQRLLDISTAINGFFIQTFYVHDCITEDLPHSRPPPELPPRSPTSTEATPPLPPNQPDLLRQISAQGAPQSSSEGN